MARFGMEQFDNISARLIGKELNKQNTKSLWRKRCLFTATETHRQNDCLASEPLRFHQRTVEPGFS